MAVDTTPEKGDGPPTMVQVSPTEMVLKPGQSVKLHARLFDAKGRFGSMVLGSASGIFFNEGRNSCALRDVAFRVTGAAVCDVELAAAPASDVEGRAACGRALVPDGEEKTLLYRKYAATTASAPRITTFFRSAPSFMTSRPPDSG